MTMDFISSMRVAFWIHTGFTSTKMASIKMVANTTIRAFTSLQYSERAKIMIGKSQRVKRLLKLRKALTTKTDFLYWLMAVSMTLTAFSLTKMASTKPAGLTIMKVIISARSTSTTMISTTVMSRHKTMINLSARLSYKSI